MTVKEIAKKQLIFAILCAFVYAFVKIAFFKFLWFLFTTDFGVDVQMDGFKGFAIAYALLAVLFSIWRGV